MLLLHMKLLGGCTYYVHICSVTIYLRLALIIPDQHKFTMLSVCLQVHCFTVNFTVKILETDYGNW